MASDLQWKVLTSPCESKIQVKKSRFLAELRNVRSENEARDFIDSIHRKYYDAKHHCFAMRIGSPGLCYERFGDDGEPSGTAGKPIFEVIKGAGLYDVCAVVTRYFGGTLLGTGNLRRAYFEAVREALISSETADIEYGVLFQAFCSFSGAEKIKRVLYSVNAAVMNEEYAECCTLTILVGERRCRPLFKKITDVTGGTAQIGNQKQVLFYMKPKAIIYKEID